MKLYCQIGGILTCMFLIFPILQDSYKNLHLKFLNFFRQDDHIIPDDRSSNSSDTELEGQEARVYSHKNKSDSPKRSVGSLVLSHCMVVSSFSI